MPVLEYHQARPRFPWRGLRKAIVWLAIVAAVILGLRALPPVKWEEFRRCVICDRREYREHTWFSATTGTGARMDPLEAWIASHETPCSHNWRCFRTSETSLFGSYWHAEVNPGTSDANLVHAAMRRLQVSDDAVAEALRQIRAGNRTAVTNMISQWETMFPKRTPVLVPATAPAPRE